MINIPKKVADRLAGGLKTYEGILKTQRDRDVSEADTVTVVKDVLNDVFGFDKYAEVTGEFAIRGTRCDLAIKLEGKLRVLIEVKAIGLDLKEQHVKQAVDYAANQGVEWVILTNSIRWVLYHVLFKQPIDKEEVADINLLALNLKKEHDLERAYLLSKEGIVKDALSDFRDRKDATSRFMLAAIITQSDAVLGTIRKEVRRVSDMLVDRGIIEKAIRDEVIKRELLEGEQATAAAKRYAKAMRGQRAATRGAATDASEAGNAPSGTADTGAGPGPGSTPRS